MHSLKSRNLTSFEAIINTVYEAFINTVWLRSASFILSPAYQPEENYSVT